MVSSEKRRRLLAYSEQILVFHVKYRIKAGNKRSFAMKNRQKQNAVRDFLRYKPSPEGGSRTDYIEKSNRRFK